MNKIYDVLSDVVDNGLDIVFVYDKFGKILWANKMMEHVTGYQRETLGEVSLSDIMPGVFCASEDSVVYKIEAIHEEFQTALYRENHTCFPVKVIIKEYEDGIYYCSAIDISDEDEYRKKLGWVKQDAENAMKERNEFVANITHELRTPVSGILGHTRNALEEEIPAGVRNTLKIIERCCGDMNKIIDNILDFSKLEAGKFVLEEREFNFKEFIDHIIETHIARINEKGLKFVFTMDDNVPEVIIGDSYHISQIINNLISNSIKFTSMGKITLQIVKTKQEGDNVELFFVVMDTGIGISDEEKDKLFRSFSQVDASISRKYGGTGLGLAVCKQIVELMHGSINVESDKGHGSMFSFSIRVKVPESEMVATSDSEAVSIADFKNTIRQKERVNEESDSSHNLDMIKGILEKLMLCVDMESWEKAELFADNLKQLLAEGEPESRRAILKLEMAVRKENQEKAITACDNLLDIIENWGGSNGE
ncbi:MAG: PAS domain-containing protein [Lachnospiraceae bacterium]|nr:PAS domain-containing protein [Lachnospiraceae bacterium]